MQPPRLAGKGQLGRGSGQCPPWPSPSWPGPLARSLVRTEGWEASGDQLPRRPGGREGMQSGKLLIYNLSLLKNWTVMSTPLRVNGLKD